jgi:hypothetical protein
VHVFALLTAGIAKSTQPHVKRLLTQRVSTSLLLQDGINAYWQAFFFSNAKYPLQNITLNGTPLQRNEFQVGPRLACWRHAATLW